MKSLKPKWQPVEINLFKFCGGDLDAEITMTVYDWDSDGTHDLIGQAYTTVNKLRAIAATPVLEGETQRPYEFHLLNPDYLEDGKHYKKNYVNSGKLEITSIHIEDAAGERAFERQAAQQAQYQQYCEAQAREAAAAEQHGLYFTVVRLSCF